MTAAGRMPDEGRRAVAGWRRSPRGERGFSLIEVMLAMVILAFAVVGVMGMFKWSDHGVQYGRHALRALAMAESRVEAKRAAAWHTLLVDDLDGDGFAELAMRDDGRDPDAVAGDGVYSAAADEPGVTLRWTLQPDRAGSLTQASLVAILATARFQVGPDHWRTLRLGTLRANPNFLGYR